MRLFVRLEDLRVITLWLHDDCTVKDAKDSIWASKRSKIAISEMRLVSGCREMKDSCKVLEYASILDPTHVHACLKRLQDKDVERHAIIMAKPASGSRLKVAPNTIEIFLHHGIVLNDGCVESSLYIRTDRDELMNGQCVWNPSLSILSFVPSDEFFYGRSYTIHFEGSCFSMRTSSSQKLCADYECNFTVAPLKPLRLIVTYIHDNLTACTTNTTTKSSINNVSCNNYNHIDDYDSNFRNDSTCMDICDMDTDDVPTCTQDMSQQSSSSIIILHRISLSLYTELIQLLSQRFHIPESAMYNITTINRFSGISRSICTNQDIVTLSESDHLSFSIDIHHQPLPSNTMSDSDMCVDTSVTTTAESWAKYNENNWVNDASGYLAVCGKMSAEDENDLLLQVVQAYAIIEDNHDGIAVAAAESIVHLPFAVVTPFSTTESTNDTNHVSTNTVSKGITSVIAIKHTTSTITSTDTIMSDNISDLLSTCTSSCYQQDHSQQHQNSQQKKLEQSEKEKEYIRNQLADAHIPSSERIEIWTSSSSYKPLIFQLSDLLEVDIHVSTNYTYSTNSNPHMNDENSNLNNNVSIATDIDRIYPMCKNNNSNNDSANNDISLSSPLPSSSSSTAAALLVNQLKTHGYAIIDISSHSSLCTTISQSIQIMNQFFNLPLSIKEEYSSISTRYLGYSNNTLYNKELYMIRNLHTYVPVLASQSLQSSMNTIHTDVVNNTTNKTHNTTQTYTSIGNDNDRSNTNGNSKISHEYNLSSSSNDYYDSKYINHCTHMNIWPDNILPEFKQHMSTCYHLYHELAMKLTTKILSTLGTDSQYIQSLYETTPNKVYTDWSMNSNGGHNINSENSTVDTYKISTSNMTAFKYNVNEGCIQESVHCPHHSDISLLTIIPLACTQYINTSSSTISDNTTNSLKDDVLGDSYDAITKSNNNDINTDPDTDPANKCHDSKVYNGTHNSVDMTNQRSGLHIYDWCIQKWMNMDLAAPTNHIVIFTGECMGYITNGYLIPCMHEVANVGPGVRLSLPYQFCPRSDSILDPSQVINTYHTPKSKYLFDSDYSTIDYDINKDNISLSDNNHNKTIDDHRYYKAIRTNEFIQHISASRISSNFPRLL